MAWLCCKWDLDGSASNSACQLSMELFKNQVLISPLHDGSEPTAWGSCPKKCLGMPIRHGRGFDGSVALAERPGVIQIKGHRLDMEVRVETDHQEPFQPKGETSKEDEPDAQRDTEPAQNIFHDNSTSNFVIKPSRTGYAETHANCLERCGDGR